MTIDIEGSRNRILVEPGARLTHVSIKVRGDDHELVIRRGVAWVGKFELLGASNRIDVGAGSTCNGAFVAAFENGTQVVFGEDCLLSTEIDIRTGDSHRLEDEAGRRLNEAQNVTIGKHVWLGRAVTVMKGVSIGEGSVVGAGAIVTKDVPPSSAVAGVPARVVRKDIRWSRRLTVEPAPSRPYVA